MLYTNIIRPLLFRFSDPEKIHHLTISGLNLVSRIPWLYWLVNKKCYATDARLRVRLGRLTLDNPVGLAAGFDKYIDAPLAYPMLGFGFAELGSITNAEQPGNPRPRLWRLPKDRGLIVYYGLANGGADKTARQLERLTNHSIPYGISIAPTTGVPLEKMADEYQKAFLKVYAYADYITLNVSCPNVASCDIFSQLSFIEDLLHQIASMVRERGIHKDIFLKIGPSHTDAELARLVQACVENKITGIIAANLLKNRAVTTFKSSAEEVNHPGGVSGTLVRDLSDHTISQIYRLANGRLKIIGVGGIFTAEDAYHKIKKGANVVQIITGFVYGGPLAVQRINKGLLKLLQHDGFDSIEQAVGCELAKE